VTSCPAGKTGRRIEARRPPPMKTARAAGRPECSYSRHSSDPGVISRAIIDGYRARMNGSDPVAHQELVIGSDRPSAAVTRLASRSDRGGTLATRQRDFVSRVQAHRG